MTTPNTNPSDLDLEALNKAYEAYDKAFPESGFITYEGLRAGIRAYLSTLRPRASGVPEAEAVAWVYQLACARDPDTGEYGDWGPAQISLIPPRVPEGAARILRTLYDAPPPVAAPSGEANETWLSGARNGYERGYWDAQHGVPSPIASEPTDAGSGEGQEMTRVEQARALFDAFDPHFYGLIKKEYGVAGTLDRLYDAGFSITRTAPSGAKP